MATLRSIGLATIFIGFLTTYGVSVTANSQTWIEVRSPNFIVVTNSTDKQARRIGSQFELIRAVFLDYFGKNSSFSGPPINILAAKDEQTLRPLLPEFWGNKNSIHPAGVYVTGFDTSFVALRLDVNIYGSTDEPYETVYHEYVHHLMRHLRSQLPLWMVEGLAEFYGNTRIESRQVLLGVPSRWKILLLRDQHLLPVSTLFDINASSPYYHEENKVSMFYAESWALTHYLITRDWIHKTQHVEDFVALLGQGVDPTEAARRSFGDLRSLDSELQDYVRRRMFTELRQNLPKIDDSAFHERALSTAESLAVRANFMAHDHHYPEAQAMLEEALKLEPKLPAAYENMGFLYFQQERTTEAAKWFAQAVELDPTNYRANYFYGASLLRAYPLDDNNVAKAEVSLRAAIKDNPNFATAYETLAYCLEQKGPHQKLDESYEMALAAVNRDPDNIHYRVRVVEVLEKQGHADDAIEAANKAVSLARTPSEEIEASAYLASAKQFKISQKKMQELQEKQSSASPSNQTAGVVNVQQPAIGGSTVPEILTDTMGVDFGPYLSQLLQIVRQHWYQLIPESASTKQGKVLLEFAILKDGSVSGLKVVQSSGDVMLDRPAYGAITASNPFAPLPTEFKGPYLGLRFSFYYNLSPSPRNSSMAPFIEDVRKKLNENLSKDNDAKTDLEHDVTALTELLDAGILDVTDNAAARYFRASAQTLLNVFRRKDGLTPDTAVNERYLSDLDRIIAARTDITAWGITRSEVAYRAGTIAWDGLHSSRTYSYWQICVDTAPCEVNLASGYTLGWQGMQPDPAKALELDLKAFDTATTYGCAGAYAAHNIAGLIYFAGASYPEDNDPVSWTQKSYALSDMIEAQSNSGDVCSGAGTRMDEFLYRLAKGDRRNSLLTEAVQRFGDKATTAPALAKYLSGSLDATAFQNAVESSKSEFGRCYAYFHAMWYASIIGDTSLVNKFYEPLPKFDKGTCPYYLVYARKFHPEGTQGQSIPTQQTQIKRDSAPSPSH